MDGHFLAVVVCQLYEGFFRDCQHAARAAGTVINKIGARLNLVRDRHENQVRHQFHHVTRSEVLSGLLVVLFVEPPDQFLENCSHGVVVETRQAHTAVLVQHGFRG